jgi:hypothetical protein
VTTTARRHETALRDSIVRRVSAAIRSCRPAAGSGCPQTTTPALRVTKAAAWPAPRPVCYGWFRDLRHRRDEKLRSAVRINRERLELIGDLPVPQEFHLETHKKPSGRSVEVFLLLRRPGLGQGSAADHQLMEASYQWSI